MRSTFSQAFRYFNPYANAWSLHQTARNVSQNLTSRYQDVRVNCGKNSMPAFLCRGVILRSTVPSNDYSSWNPSPHSQNSGGVSFTFLSKDVKFKRSGVWPKKWFYFLPRPVQAAPAHRQIEILCAYPTDGATQLRDKPGCGAHPYAPDRSRRCQTIGVTTAEQWIANRRQNIWNMCSFDVRDSMNDLGADSFYQSIRAHSLGDLLCGSLRLYRVGFGHLATKYSAELPIEAFYYLDRGFGRCAT